MERLSPPDKPYPGRAYGGTQGERYLAPGEWRGDAEALRPEVSKVVVGKVRKFRVKMLIVGLIVASIVAWLVLSFTVWGNPSPGKVSGRLIDAVNARDEEAFLDLFQEENRPAAGDLYATVSSYMGSLGRFENVKLEVDERNNYDAIAYIESADVVSGSGSTRSISRSDNLMVVMENHKGRWYVEPRGTDILP